MKKNYLLVTFATFLLVGCNNEIKDSDINFSKESGAKVSFSAVINNQEASDLVTRATETSWAMGDKVGITCGSNQANVEYEYTGGENSLFTATGGNAEEIWVLGTARI